MTWSRPQPDIAFAICHFSRSGDVIHPLLPNVGLGTRHAHDYALFALSRGFHVRASSLPVETHCEDGGWIQPGLNLFSFSDAIKTLVN